MQEHDVGTDRVQVRDDPFGTYRQLAGYLSGRGVPSVDEALKEIFLQPLHYPFKELVNADMFRRLIEASATTEDRRPAADGRRPSAGVQPTIESDQGTAVGGPSSEVNSDLLDEVEQKMLRVLDEVKQFTESRGETAPIAREVMEAILRPPGNP